jgi:hypothetical protein
VRPRRGIASCVTPLSLFKAEAEDIVSSSCCGPALTYFKSEFIMKARQLLFFKAEVKEIVSSFLRDINVAVF